MHELLAKKIYSLEICDKVIDAFVKGKIASKIL